jgi:hypothetical protein
MMYAIPNQETEAQVQLLLYQIESSEIPEAISKLLIRFDKYDI